MATKIKQHNKTFKAISDCSADANRYFNVEERNFYLIFCWHCGILLQISTLLYYLYTGWCPLQPQQSIREVSDVLIIFPLFTVTLWDNFTYLWHSDSCHILCVYPPLRLEFLFQIWKLNKCYINLSLTQRDMLRYLSQELFRHGHLENLCKLLD